MDLRDAILLLPPTSPRAMAGEVDILSPAAEPRCRTNLDNVSSR